MEATTPLTTAELVREALEAAHSALTEQLKWFGMDRDTKTLMGIAERVVRLCNEAFQSGLAT